MPNLNNLGFDEASTAMHEVDTLAVPVPLVGAIQTLDNGVADVLKVIVVDVDVLGDVVAVVTANFEGFVNGCKVPAHLLWDASGNLSVTIKSTIRTNNHTPH